MTSTEISPMDLALRLAQTAAERGEVPVGAVIVDRSGAITATAHNMMHQGCDPTAHAEVNAIRQACALLNQSRLTGYDLYVTLEPCPLCAAAISFARIRRLYFGAYDVKGGAVDHGIRYFSHPSCHHRPEIFGGISERQSAALLTGFFSAKRSAGNGDL